MNRNYELIVFDWDGTLMDSAAAIVQSIQSSCADLGLDIPEEGACRQIIGLGLNEAIAALLPQLDPADYDRLTARYRYHYLAQDEGIPLFPGVAETLAALNDRGYLLAVATGKSRKGLDRVLASTGLRDYFHASRCADECFSKPHPAMLNELLDQFGLRSPQALMIGDTTHDLQMARNASVPGVAVSYGAHPKAQLTEMQPLACVDNFEELTKWLKTNA